MKDRQPTGPVPRSGIVARSRTVCYRGRIKRLTLLLSLVVPLGCAAPQPSPSRSAPARILPPPQPVISDADQGRVKIQFPTVLNLDYQPLHQAQTLSLLQAEADRACGVYGRIASQPVSARCTSVQLFSDLPLPQFDEIEHRMNNYGTASGNEHGYCKTQEHLFMCAPADGMD